MPTRSISEVDLASLAERVLARLGLQGDGLVRRWTDFKFTTGRHIVRQAFDTIKVRAVFGFTKNRISSPNTFSPILYLAIARDDEQADYIHRLVWSQGVVPILLIVTPNGLHIRKSLGPPTAKPVSISWVQFDGGSPLPVELTSLTATALASSIVWNDFIVDRSARVDSALLTAITSLNSSICAQFPDLGQRAHLVNSIIGRFIYLFILVDRGIITESWVKALKDEGGKPLCATIAKSAFNEDGLDDQPWPGREIWALFDRIDGVMNGTIFPIASTERRLIPSSVLHLIKRAIRHGDQLNQASRQLGFLNVSFATLRTETISAIYELFLLIEAPNAKSDDGAFYTPPYLVDYVLDEVDRIRPFSAASRILDPAAGSGIFLVGAYRRVIERSLPSGRWKATHFQKARALLERSIFGIERNAQAANVTRFSLYLTLLDYVENASINDLRKLVGRKKVFPQLNRNILGEDVFAIPAKKHSDRYTHVVGNPPWGTFGKHSDRTNIQRTAEAIEQRNADLQPAIQFLKTLDSAEHPITNKRLSELFIWKVQRDLIQEGGVLGVLISTRSFVARTASGFPTALAKHMKLVGLANLSHFRYRLFSGARSPALAIFAEAKEANSLDRIWIYNPLLTSQPIGQRGHLWSIVVSELDIEHYRLRDLSRRDDAWFEALMLRPIDRRFATYLKLWAKHYKFSLSDFINASELSIGRGGSPSQTGLPKTLLLGTEDYLSRLGMDGLGFTQYPHSELEALSPHSSFEKMFSGNIVLIPRHMKDVIFVEKPVAFGSSFNAIYPLGTKANSQHIIRMRAIRRFLMSPVARYMYAIFGKTWVLDRTRLEKNDLGDIPFPFFDCVEKIETLTDEELTKMFADKIGLDKIFVDCIEEYSNFRNGYEDSQIPNAALTAPSQASVSHYQSTLNQQLGLQLGSQAQIEQSFTEPTDNMPFAQIRVQIWRRPSTADKAEAKALKTLTPPTSFNPQTAIVFDAAHSQVEVTKPWTRVAWTIEQAFSDARAISEEIFRTGI